MIREGHAYRISLFRSEAMSLQRLGLIDGNHAEGSGSDAMVDRRSKRTDALYDQQIIWTGQIGLRLADSMNHGISEGIEYSRSTVVVGYEQQVLLVPRKKQIRCLDQYRKCGSNRTSAMILFLVLRRWCHQW